MCMYSCEEDGLTQPWHAVHYGSLATGGAGLVLSEACAVTPEGRISRNDLGIWSDEHVSGLARIGHFARSQGAQFGVQLAHAGRKAGCQRPWEGGGVLPLDQGGWIGVAPSALPFSKAFPNPIALDEAGIASVIEAFRAAAVRCRTAEVDVLELHAAHGYLLNAFLSPLSNKRDDRWGGSFEGRCRLLEHVVDAVRGEWPDDKPLFVRVSATDWVAGGWTAEDTVALARRLTSRGVDLLDCSSGGAVPARPPNIEPNFQVPFAAQVRQETGLATGAVGLITSPTQANRIVENGQADLVFLARQLLREPSWPVRAAFELGQEQPLPPQYLRGRYRG